MALTHTDVRQILDILDRAQHLDSLEIRIGDYLLRANKHGSHPQEDQADQIAQSALAAMPSPSTAKDTFTVSEDDIPAGLIAIRAPMVGTFYRRPKPDEAPFVEEGQHVEAGDPLALLEAMKLFNTVSAPVSGRVVRIPCADGTLVQRNAALVLIEPDSQA